MNASLTAREIARANLTRAITDAARHQLAVDGAVRLSVRAVARELGLASSAVYRYFPTRDDLLTALIIDAYNALGSAVEQADRSADGDDFRSRWRSMCNTARTWAREHPHEYGLIFGAPVPDYRAPQDTVAAATRVPTAMAALFARAHAAGRIRPADTALPGGLGGQLTDVAAALAVDLPAALTVRMTVAWTQLFGLITFELFGQFVGAFEPADDLFAAAVELMADLVGFASAD